MNRLIPLPRVDSGERLCSLLLANFNVTSLLMLVGYYGARRPDNPIPPFNRYRHTRGANWLRYDGPDALS